MAASSCASSRAAPAATYPSRPNAAAQRGRSPPAVSSSPLPTLLLLLLIGMSCAVGSAGAPGSAGWYARDGAAAAEAMGLDGSTGDVVAVGAASALQVAQGAESEDDGGEDDDVEGAGDDDGDDDMQMKTCAPTPRDVLGPFYLPGAPPLKYFCRRDKSVAATPQLKMKGWVKDASTCTRINGTKTGALVEVWQADNAGNYDAAGYNCRTAINVRRSGKYGYNSIMPASYGRVDCLRPAHVHVRASAAGYRTLVTQMYFAGDEYLGDNDCGCGRACSSGNEALHANLTCRGQRKLRCWGRFDIYLERV